MDLREFYDRIEALIVSLRTSDDLNAANSVEAAIRGGATSGEILDRLSGALPKAGTAGPEVAVEVVELQAFIRGALQ
jgi:hypothetical protein